MTILLCYSTKFLCTDLFYFDRALVKLVNDDILIFVNDFGFFFWVHCFMLAVILMHAVESWCFSPFKQVKLERIRYAYNQYFRSEFVSFGIVMDYLCTRFEQLY